MLTYSHENKNRVVDPKPILPASNDILGIPSKGVKLTTASASASFTAYHGNDTQSNLSVSVGRKRLR